MAGRQNEPLSRKADRLTLSETYHVAPFVKTDDPRPVGDDRTAIVGHLDTLIERDLIGFRGRQRLKGDLLAGRACNRAVDSAMLIAMGVIEGQCPIIGLP